MLRRLRPGVLRARNLSTVSIAEEVRDALNANKPVVSLESTIISHGLPYPQNLQMAQRVEQEIRRCGAIPATTAFIHGQPKVGLSSPEIEILASASANKVSRRDIPYVMAHRLHGGTTISGTMILSHAAGIRVFATGGLGGVHRDGENTMDVSADLDELGRTPVAVVCAGPKSILDIERTMEYLETKGVFVGTMGPEGTNIPGFYTRDSGVKSVYNFTEFEDAARVIHEADAMGLQTGQLFCIPPPEGIAMAPEFINGIIDEANREAHEKGIKGKHLTPFLLSKIAQATNGESVKTNVEFVLNNARCASEIAKQLVKLNGGFKSSAQPAAVVKPPPATLESYKSVVVGSIALDTYGKMKGEAIIGDSNPTTISSSIGGVGYNVARESTGSGNTSLKFLGVVGQDIYGDKIANSIVIPHSLERSKDKQTGQYISFHDTQGGLVIAASDMSITEEEMSTQFIGQEIEAAKPDIVLTDCNISQDMISFIYSLSKKHGFKYVIEPTSVPKSKKIAFSSLKTTHPLHLITPTVTELETIYEAMDTRAKFDVDDWFPVIDELGVDKTMRTRLEALTTRNPKYKKLLARGIAQMGVSLLPFVEKIVVKDGANGVFFFSRSTETPEQLEKESQASVSIVTPQGVLFEHYDVPEILEQGPRNVTGAGDALAGALLAALVENPLVLDAAQSRSEVITRAQKAAISRIK